MPKNKNIIECISEEIKRLQESEELLKRVYSERGPYKDGKISDETWSLIRYYFEFDDSE